MKLSSRKELLKESEMKLTEIRKSLNEDPIDPYGGDPIPSLFAKAARMTPLELFKSIMVNKTDSAKLHKETLITFMKRMLEQMRSGLEDQNISDDTKSATSDILDGIEKDIRAKIQSNQLTDSKDVEKYAITKLLQIASKAKR